MADDLRDTSTLDIDRLCHRNVLALSLLCVEGFHLDRTLRPPLLHILSLPHESLDVGFAELLDVGLAGEAAVDAVRRRVERRLDRAQFADLFHILLEVRELVVRFLRLHFALLRLA